jgi:uncharacterized membrane-anchored protein
MTLMSMTLSASEPHGIAGPVVLILFIVSGIVFATGYAMAVMHRANRDYKATKAALPILRKGFWKALFAVVKVGFWVAVAAFILIAWMIRDVRHGADADSTPSPSPTVKASVHSRR